MRPEPSIEGFRLSPQQRRLWSAQQDENASGHHAHCALLIEGDLDATALEEALGDVTRRHEILRTTFHSVPGAGFPLQVVGDTRPRLEQRDARGVAESLQASSIDQALAAQVLDFDLAAGDLLHATLLVLAPRRYVLLIGLPALCADAVTLRNIMAELASLYRARRAGAGYNAPVVQYAQYAEWRNQADAEDADGEAGRAYWSQLALPAVTLPFERRGHGAPASWSASLDLGLRQAVEAFADRCRTTPEAVLLGCWQLLLARFTGERLVVVQKLFDGRPYEELKSALGLYAQRLPVLGSFGPAATFHDITREVDVGIQRAAEQETYFSPRSSTEAVIGFEYHEREPPLDAGDVSFGMLQLHAGLERCKLSLTCVASDEGIALEIVYDSGRYDDQDIRRMVRCLSTLLASVLRQPDTPVGALNLLAEDDHRQVVVDWNATSAPIPAHPIHRLFEQHAARTPGSPALVCADETLGYAELNAKANQLAHRLRRLGAGAGSAVGLCTDRSSAMVIGLLGILKAGAAYVPLSPEYPQRRLMQQLAQVEVSIVVSQGHLVGGLPPLADVVLCLDRDAEDLDRECARNPDFPVAMTDLAYVIFTSGSTGVPRGVAVTHASLANYTGFMCEKLGLADSPPLHFATVTTLSADLGNTAIFPSLASGGCLHVLDYDAVVDAERFAGYVERHPLDVLKVVPSHFNALLAAGAGVLPRQFLIFGGEALPWALVDLVRELGARCRIINHYGPTEATVGCLTFEVEPVSLPAGPSIVPIGRPIANAQAYVLDRLMRPVPVGVVGELYVGGLGVARGYANQPGATAERFVPDPLSGTGGVRLYRTGDRARYLPDGNIEFLGRTDDQIKIRGFRMEPGEIEAALVSHPAVRQAVAIAREDTAGEKRLVAYLTGDGLPSMADLRRFLAERLPDYLVPHTLVAVAALPLTRNGKIDRTALPVPERAPAASDRGVTAPRTPIEEAVGAIWAELLKVERVGIRDNFFELGGHSLLVTQVISRVRQVFQIELPLQTLFEAPTVEGMSLQVAQRLGSASPATPISTRAAGGPAPLSFAQQRLWFLSHLEPGSTAYNVPSAHRLRGELNIAALQASLNEVVRRHAVLRTTFAVLDGEPVQRIEPACEMALPLTDLSHLPPDRRDAEALALVAVEARHPFDIGVDRCFRAQLLRLGPSDHVLLLSLHHLVSDGWSRVVLHRELSAVYGAFTQGNPSPLPELPIQYADYAVWQRRWLDQAESERQVAYWRERLRGAPPVTELVLDYARRAVQEHRGAYTTLTLSHGLTAGLRALSVRQHATLFMTLLAAFKVLLHRYSGQEDLVVGTHIAGRNRRELEDLIGFFIGTLMLRTDASGNPSFRTFLARVRQTALGAYTHQDVPFERIIEALEPERSLSHTPLVQVVFNMLNFPEGELELAGVAVEELHPSGVDSKFDLTLYAREHTDGITLLAAYDPDLFHGSTISRLLEHFQTLLEGVVADPDCRLWQLPLLTGEERRLLGRQEGGRHTGSWSDAGPPGIDQSIVQRFEYQVLKGPARLAVRTPTHVWSYGELNRAANRTAHALLRLQESGPESIALLLDHGAPMVGALLGVLKAGKSYVPLDPRHPPHRLAALLDNSQAAALVTNAVNRPLAEALGAGRLPLVDIDALDTPESNLDVPVSPDALAYILYTSGSTGQPKGVVQSHRNVLHFMRAYTNALHLGEHDRLTLLASYESDAAVMDLFAALLNGAALYPLDLREITLLEVARRLIEHEVTIYHSTPTVFRHFAAALTDQEFPALRLIVLGGEAVVRSDVALYQARFRPPCRFVNGYGLTESSVTLQSFMDHQTKVTRDAVAIGYPVEDTEVVLLDATGEPTELYGEIAIDSAHVALGYWREPSGSAQRFLAHPHDPTKRRYLTGDMGRRMADGSLIFAGRRDTQVKLRGYRIELGEIGAVAARHPAVRECVAALRDDGPDPRIVAYVVPHQGRVPLAELRRLLEATLPDYMVPSGFVVLEQLPLTATHKLDLRALPAPAPLPGLVASDGVPRSSLEQSLATIWAGVLKVESVGVHDNFFDLGGHSLLAMQLVSRINERLQLELSVRVVFEHPTLAGMAMAITQSP